jgi:hypothetical protein
MAAVSPAIDSARTAQRWNARVKNVQRPLRQLGAVTLCAALGACSHEPVCAMMS